MRRFYLFCALGSLLAVGIGTWLTLRGETQIVSEIWIGPIFLICIVIGLLAVSYSVIVVHELGHLFVLQHYGFRLNHIVICGKVVYAQFPRRPEPWPDLPFSMSGHINYSAPDMLDYRRKMINILWGGPLASFALLTVLASLTYLCFLNHSLDGVLFWGLAACIATVPLINGFREDAPNNLPDFLRIRSLRGERYALESFAYHEIQNFFAHSEGLHQIPEPFYLAAINGFNDQPLIRGFLFNWYSFWLQSRSRFSEALVRFEQCLEAGSGQPETDNLLDHAFLLALVGDLALGKQKFDLVVQEEATYPFDVPLAESAIAYRQGDFLLAISKLDDAVKLWHETTPDDHPHRTVTRIRLKRVREYYLTSSATSQDSGAEADA